MSTANSRFKVTCSSILDAFHCLRVWRALGNAGRGDGWTLPQLKERTQGVSDDWLQNAVELLTNGSAANGPVQIVFFGENRSRDFRIVRRENAIADIEIPQLPEDEMCTLAIAQPKPPFET